MRRQPVSTTGEQPGSNIAASHACKFQSVAGVVEVDVVNSDGIDERCGKGLHACVATEAIPGVYKAANVDVPVAASTGADFAKLGGIGVLKLRLNRRFDCLALFRRKWYGLMRNAVVPADVRPGARGNGHCKSNNCESAHSIPHELISRDNCISARAHGVSILPEARSPAVILDRALSAARFGG